MGIFENPLRLTYLDGADWEVLETFIYDTEIEGRKTVILVPAGFHTDFASIPRIFWRVLPPTGKYGKAAVIHDYIYRTPAVNLSRAQADQVFRDAMQDLGVNATTRNIMWAGVRAFGSRAYKPR